jgi:hypothetical protein
MDKEHVTRIIQALYLFGSERLLVVLSRAEERFMELFDECDSYNIASVFKSFSMMFKGRSFGRDRSMVELEPKILK